MLRVFAAAVTTGSRLARLPGGTSLVARKHLGLHRRRGDFKFALTGRKIGSLDLHAVGIILMLAGVVGMLLPVLIRNRSRLYRPITRNRQAVIDERSRTVARHTDGSQTLRYLPTDGQRAPSSRQPWG